jgi:hypothetical protein
VKGLAIGTKRTEHENAPVIISSTLSYHPALKAAQDSLASFMLGCRLEMEEHTCGEDGVEVNFSSVIMVSQVVHNRTATRRRVKGETHCVSRYFSPPS